MAAPTVLNPSNYDSGTGVCLFYLPTGWQADDHVVLVAATANQAIGIAAGFTGWTELSASPQGTGTAGAIGGVRLTAWIKKVAAGEPVPDCTDSGNHQILTSFGIRGADPTTPIELIVGGVLSTAGTTVTLSSPGTTSGPDRTVVLVVASDRDTSATTTFSSWTNANLTGITEVADWGTVAGVGSAIGIAYGTKGTAGAIGSSTVTQAASVTAAWIAIAFKPAAAGTPVGAGTETDSASSLSGKHSRATGVSTETDTASALFSPVAAPVGLATETNTASALGAKQTGTTGVATEADSASALSGKHIRGLGLASETDTAVALTSTFSGAVGTALETDTAVGRTLPTYQVRYIRDRLNGALGNAASYFVEIEAYNNVGANVAVGATVTANFVPGSGTLSQITNGNTATGDYCASFDADAVVTVDLGSLMDISGVRRWHYHGDGRTFYDTRTEISQDGIVWTVIFDSYVSGTYAETSAGKYDLALPTSTVLDNRQIGSVIPIYTFDSGVWSTYTASAATLPSWGVMNPDSGPGVTYDSGYASQVADFRAAGGRAVGYISTSYAGTVNTARTVAAVQADVDTWYSLYGHLLDGFFLDEVTTSDSAGNLAYYEAVRDYIKAINPSLYIIGNAGNYVKEAYIAQDLLDHGVLFEQTGTLFESYVPPAWVGRYNRHRFSYLIHTASQAQAEAAVDKARAENVQYVFATDVGMPNPWWIAPDYWSAFVTKAEGPGGFLARVYETDSASALAGKHTLAFTPASEADTAEALAGRVILPTGEAAETDTAFALGGSSQSGAVGTATETDTAGTLTGKSFQTSGAALEADAAASLAGRHSSPTGSASETDAAFALAPYSPGATGLASETDTASGLVGLHQRAAGLASEADSASSLSGRHRQAVTPSLESDTASSRAGLHKRALAPGLESDTASGLAGKHSKALGLSSEADTAGTLAGIQRLGVSAASESDSAAALTSPGTGFAGIASESDTAFALAAVHRLLVGIALEIDSAAALAPGDGLPDEEPSFGGGSRYIKAAPLRPRKLFEEDPPEPEVVAAPPLPKPKPPISLIKQALAPKEPAAKSLPLRGAPTITEPSRPRLTAMMAALLDDD